MQQHRESEQRKDRAGKKYGHRTAFTPASRAAVQLQRSLNRIRQVDVYFSRVKFQIKPLSDENGGNSCADSEQDTDDAKRDQPGSLIFFDWRPAARARIWDWFKLHAVCMNLITPDSERQATTGILPARRNRIFDFISSPNNPSAS